MATYYLIRQDLGEHAWHEEDGFFHGYINGVYYRMVCTANPLILSRCKEPRGQRKKFDQLVMVQ